MHDIVMIVGLSTIIFGAIWALIGVAKIVCYASSMVLCVNRDDEKDDSIEIIDEDE